MIVVDAALVFVSGLCAWVLLISVFDSDDTMHREWSLRAQNDSTTTARVSRFIGAVLFTLIVWRLIP
jgi:hypothetical protein